MNFVSRTAARLAAMLAISAGAAMAADAHDPYLRDRGRMLEEIRLLARKTGSETGRPVFSERVTAAMSKVPRHEFVPEAAKGNAYDNRPLPIGDGQTISQPYIVALMTDLAAPGAGDRVLEVGTGSGYQAAVLAEQAGHVYTIELVEALARAAAERLSRLGYTNVTTRVGDGYQGWPEHAPYDVIVVTAAPRSIPQPLVDQLAPGGRLVAPVGSDGAGQHLVVVEKGADGRLVQRSVLGVRFVPLNDPAGRQQ